MKTAQDYGSPVKIIETVEQINKERKLSMAGRIIKACGGSVDGKTIAVLGLAFKPNTDDMRDSPSLDIIPELQKKGAYVQAYDPEAMGEAAELLSDVDYKANAYETIEGADALVIVTEWDQFRALDLTRVKNLLSSPIIVDLRNIYVPQEMDEMGFSYSSIGRP